MTNQIFFNGHNINGGELRIVRRDPNTDISFGANQFGNTSASNEHLLGAGKMTVPNHFNGQNIDGGQQHGPGGMTNKKIRSNNEVPAPDNSFIGQNLIQGKDGENHWGMHVAIAKDKDVWMLSTPETTIMKKRLMHQMRKMEKNLPHDNLMFILYVNSWLALSFLSN